MKPLFCHFCYIYYIYYVYILFAASSSKINTPKNYYNTKKMQKNTRVLAYMQNFLYLCTGFEKKSLFSQIFPTKHFILLLKKLFYFIYAIRITETRANVDR